MSNFRFDMTCERDHVLEDAMKLVFMVRDLDQKTIGGGTQGVTHYAVRDPVEGDRAANGSWRYNRAPKNRRLIFFNHHDREPADSDNVALPFTLDAAGCTEFALRWLAEADYGEEPDTDGHNEKGWRLYCEDWCSVDDSSSAVFAISPAWATYSK